VCGRSRATSGDVLTLRDMEYPHSLTCTLLIPQSLWARICKPGENRRISSLVRVVLMRAAMSKTGRTGAGRINMRYQAAGQDLRRFNFRLAPGLWQKLGMHARVMEVSRCRAFAILVEDFLADTQNAGTPALSDFPPFARHWVAISEI